MFFICISWFVHRFFVVTIIWHFLTTIITNNVTISTFINDNEFSYFWISYLWTTNIFFLPLWLGLTVIWTLYHKRLPELTFHILLSTVVGLICFHEIWTSFLIENWTYLNENIFHENQFLTNRLNKIHPAIFFFAWSYLNGLLITHCKIELRYTHHNEWFFCLSTLLLIILGSWWAFQEGTWGGWWNWDASEVLALLLFILFLERYHRVYILKQVWERNAILIWLQIEISVLIFLFSILQLSFSLSSHSFGIKFSHLFSNDTIFLCFVWIGLWIFNHNHHSAIRRFRENRLDTLNIGFTVKWKFIIMYLFTLLLFITLPPFDSISIRINENLSTLLFYDFMCISLSALFSLSWWVFWYYLFVSRGILIMIFPTIFNTFAPLWAILYPLFHRFRASPVLHLSILFLFIFVLSAHLSLSPIIEIEHPHLIEFWRWEFNLSQYYYSIEAISHRENFIPSLIVLNFEGVTILTFWLLCFILFYRFK